MKLQALQDPTSERWNEKASFRRLGIPGDPLRSLGLLALETETDL